MRSEEELRKRLTELRIAHSKAVMSGLSEETIAIGVHKIRQLEWILEQGEE